MGRIAPILAVLVMSGMSLPGIAGDPKKASKELQGAWLLTDLVVGGIKVPEKEIKDLRFIFKADKLTIIAPPGDISDIQPQVFVILGIAMGANVPPPRLVDDRTFSVKLDPAKQPAAVDLTALDGEAKGSVSPGIYEVKGDVLRWCQSDDPKNAERPKTFVSPEKSQIYLFTFKRAK